MGHPHPFCAAASFRIFASQKCKLISWARLRKKRVGVAPTVILSPYIYIFYIFFFLPVACMKFNGSHFVVVVVATPGTPLCKTFRAVLACELCIRIFLRHCRLRNYSSWLNLMLGEMKNELPADGQQEIWLINRENIW